MFARLFDKADSNKTQSRKSRSTPRKKKHRFQPTVESLECREMLDTGLANSLVTPAAVTDSVASRSIIDGGIIIVVGDTPTLHQPTTVNGITTFNWTSVNYTSSYELRIQHTWTGQTFHIPGITGTTYSKELFTSTDLGNYMVQVKAISKYGSSAGWSSAKFVKVEPGPGTPALSAPTVNDYGGAAFDWTKAGNTKNYQVQVIDATGNVVETRSGITDTNTTISRLETGSYTARVRAFDWSDRAGRWSNLRSFSLTNKLAPATPKIEDIRVNADGTTTITWSKAWNASRYKLQINDVWYYNLIIADNVPETSHTVRLAFDLRPYRVYVWGINSSGVKGAYDVRTFSLSPNERVSLSTNSAPAEVVPAATNLPGTAQVTSARTAKGVTDIRWNAATHGSTYRIYLYNYHTRKRTYLNDLSGTTLKTKLAAGRYAIRMRAYNEMGHPGNWTSAKHFTVRHNIPRPSVPTWSWAVARNGTTSFRWKAAKNAGHYRVYIRNVKTGQSYQLDDLTSTAARKELTSGDYRVWVRAFNSNGQAGKWSAPKLFNVAR